MGDDGPRHALVVGANTLAWWVDWEDRNPCILFGDGDRAMEYSLPLSSCVSTFRITVRISLGSVERELPLLEGTRPC